MGVEMVIEHASGCRNPLTGPHPWYVLIELSSQARSGLRENLEGILAEGLERGLIEDATIADSLDQAEDVLAHPRDVRRGAAPGRRLDQARRLGAGRVGAGIHPEASEAVVKLIPGARPLPFGHLGDGNIHYNVTQPVGADKAAYLKRWHDMNDVVFAVVKKFGGSISAEHGIGVMKRDLLPSVKDPVALRPDAHAQAHARSQGHPQSRQGAVAARPAALSFRPRRIRTLERPVAFFHSSAARIV